MPLPSRHPLVALAAGAWLSACAGGSVPGPGATGYPYNVQGSYEGRFVFDGQPFDASLQLRTESGGRVRGAFLIAPPMSIEGRAEGVVIDDLLRLTVTYRSAEGCDGTVEGILDIEPGGRTFEGPVTVRDCAPPVAGRMSFSLRDRTPG